MLIGFRVGNFRSFRDEQAFSFSTSSDSAHAATHCLGTGVKSVPRLLRSALIFGPNSAGKTNFIYAFAVMREVILRSTIATAAQYAEWYMPFRLGSAPHLPTQFEVDVLLEGIRYRYAFSFDSQRIRSERLLVYSTGKSQRWFERRVDEATQAETWMPFSHHFNGPRAMWREATRPGSLFLTTAAQLNSEQLQPLFRWFEHGVEILFSSQSMNSSRLAAAIKDAAFKKRMLEFLHSADVHVDDVRVSESEAARSPALRAVVNKWPPNAGDHPAIEFSHPREDGDAIWMRSLDESAGIQRLVSLFGPLFTAIEQGRLLLIDEFDVSLHPLVARYLIQLMNDPELSTHGAQLLLTSHNTTLMDVSILRRDEIWLVSLDDGEASTLTSVWRSPVPPRKHEIIAKSYLSGRFGAIPNIRPKAQNAAFTRESTLPARRSKAAN